ncbi:MAG: hypothetical protein JO152_11830 [Mycobacteriaceae bacterium]|nr:hypothetical protein [Mycobacteriaceae bacterium]
MKRQAVLPDPPSVGDAVRSAAMVAGAVVLVLGLLVAVVYAAVFIDLVPALR